VSAGSRSCTSMGAAVALAALAAGLLVGAPVAGAAGAGPLPVVTMSASRVSAGQWFACAVQTDSTLACFGSNGYGQLGVDRRPYSLVGKRATGLSSVRQVTAGWDHACALLSNKTVRCFGHNAFGEVGTGSVGGDVYVPGGAVAGLSGALSVAAGWQHTCALNSRHGVVCWGRNTFGQVGDASTATAATPRAVRGLTAHVATITSGANFSCALTSTHHVMCWGQNASGELGRAPGAVPYSPTPVNIPGIGNAVSISAGFGHACAVLATRRVTCWGANARGQAGLAPTVLWTSVPRLVAGVASATSVAAGYDHTCALRANHSVVCWGWNREGQIGNARTGRVSPPRAVVGANGATSVTAGYQFGCATLPGALVKCWGTGGQGQLGVGGRAQWAFANYPAKVRVPGP